jgi:methyltransferase
MAVALVILLLVTVQRLAELRLSAQNTVALMARGGLEYGAGHYPYLVLIHSFWLIGLWLFALSEPVDPGWLGVYLVLQLLRIWVLVSLGRRWTTRIIVVPGEKLVRCGPYRFIRHPNYVVLVGEVAVLPLVFGLDWFALVFSIANAVILSIRLSVETAALATLSPRALS